MTRRPPVRRPRSSRAAYVAAVLAGALTVFGYEPFGFALLPVATLAALFLLLQHARSARDGGWLGFAFGLGLFVAGVSWVYVAIERFGGMPPVLAAIGTGGFCAYLALWPALAGWATVRLVPGPSIARALASAAAWTLGEWLRGSMLSGFPWLSVGYAWSPAHGLAGLAPLGGVFLVSLAVSLAAAALAIAVGALAEARGRVALASAAGIVAILAAGALADRLSWTTPSGAPLAVSLVQGNVTQDRKFDPDFRERTYTLYEELVAKSRGRLVVLPESAFPVFAPEVPREVVQGLADAARARNGDLLLGLFTLDPPPIAGGQPRYYNSVVSVGTSDTQVYRKHHLVPFGETIPLEPIVGWLMDRMLAIPLASQSPGPRNPPPMTLAGERVALDICYEDVFGDLIAEQARTATLLVNVTNDAWYGHSIAAWQHNQIAQMRAKETGRPMLRATNTGVTSAIDAHGREVARLPWFTRDVLEIEIAGTTGLTPYVRFGDAPALAIAALLFGVLAFRYAKAPGGAGRPVESR